MKQYKILFADLDDTLITTESGNTFPIGIWDMKFKFDVLDAIKNLNPKYICIVTNQGGIKKGFVSLSSFQYKFDYIVQSIYDYANIKTIGAYCDTDDVNNIRRKPNNGMLSELFYFINTHDNISYTKSDCLMIGDASGLEGQFSDSDKKTADNFNIDYLDVNEFINIYK